ncbi:hypothetical protein ACIQVC_29245 [Streptomyces sp. NPDC101112]|uniref:hypothetical protein n=1 Tax=Streptomyces sp. NPDC101112 TaxID=3366105 RepID=UPI0037F217F9
MVRLLLVVGGLFVLGILCGGRASAAEGATTSAAVDTSALAQRSGDTGPVETTGVVDDVVTSAGGQIVETVTPDAVRPVVREAVRSVAREVARPVAREVVRPVTRVAVRPVPERVVRPVSRDVVHPAPVVDGVLRPVTEDVLRPVGDVVGAVAGGPGDAASFPPEAQMPSWPEGSGWPGVPEWPDAAELPDVPELPQLPGVPAWPALPGETLPVEVTPREPGAVRPEEAGQDVDGGRERHVGPVRVVHGPFAGDGDMAAVAAPHRDAGAGDVRVGRTVEPQAPDGVPTGALGGHSAVDNGGPRHAEPHAVTSLHRAPLSLAPGATAADVADGTRERHRDIPEFPG